MPLLYPIKRIFRSWKLFIALLIGIILASTFFAGIDVKANLTAKQALDQQISGIEVDMEFTAHLNSSNLVKAQPAILSIDGVADLTLLFQSGLQVSVPSENYSVPSENYSVPSENYSVPSDLVPSDSVPSEEYSVIRYMRAAGLQNCSGVYEGWLNRPVEEIGENETYILAGSSLADIVEVNSTIQIALQFSDPKRGNTTTVNLNLTVMGFAQLDDDAYALASGYSYYISPLGPTVPGQEFRYRPDLLLFSWENTIQKIWSTMPDTAFETRFLIYLDRDRLISPWDTQTSADNINKIADNIENMILADFEHHVIVENNLESALRVFGYSFSGIWITFILVSLPIFFVAWYMGSTVSDVSFNLRRREIGLLSTKGLSSGQIQRMFFGEALFIGLAGGILGVFGGLLLNQVFTGFNLETLFNPQLLSPYTMVFTVAFGIILSLLSVFNSARKASRLPTVDALKEYLSMDTDKPYRKRLPWLAFILGTYKIIVFILGINIPSLLTPIGFVGGNYIFAILLGILAIIDQVLTYVGPLFFFWGFTKLFIQNSLKFQQLTSQVYRLMGDLGALAAKNVRRNPARSAAIAFLIALIIGYGVQVTGQLASEQDYAFRRVQYNVGADITVSVMNATEAQTVLDSIVGNVSEIRNATMECTLTQQYAGTQMKTIDPDSWLETAYYEKEWFSGASFEEAFDQLRTNNQTIILERRKAMERDLKVGDEIGIDFRSGARKLKIVGFFGPEPAELGGMAQYVLPTWSFVPRNLFNMSSPFSEAYTAEFFDTKILLKLNEGANGTRVAETIRSLDLEIFGVTSFEEEMTKAQTYGITYFEGGVMIVQTSPTTNTSFQVLDVQRLGLIFAVLAASVGTALISIVSMRERSREATLMSVKGLSYRQLVWMFLTENLAVVTFAIVLGLSVGLIIVYGNVTSTSAVTSELVKRRFVFPQEAIITIASCASLIFASTILPIIVMSRQYVTKLERMISLR